MQRTSPNTERADEGAEGSAVVAEDVEGSVVDRMSEAKLRVSDEVPSKNDGDRAPTDRLLELREVGIETCEAVSTAFEERRHPGRDLGIFQLFAASSRRRRKSRTAAAFSGWTRPMLQHGQGTYVMASRST